MTGVVLLQVAELRNWARPVRGSLALLVMSLAVVFLARGREPGLPAAQTTAARTYRAGLTPHDPAHAETITASEFCCDLSSAPAAQRHSSVASCG